MVDIGGVVAGETLAADHIFEALFMCVESQRLLAVVVSQVRFWHVSDTRSNVLDVRKVVLVLVGGRALTQGQFQSVYGAVCLVLVCACFALLRLGLVEPLFLCLASLLCGSGIGFLRSNLPL
jgi:hypothetical protein